MSEIRENEIVHILLDYIKLKAENEDLLAENNKLKANADKLKAKEWAPTTETMDNYRHGKTR